MRVWCEWMMEKSRERGGERRERESGVRGIKEWVDRVGLESTCSWSSREMEGGVRRMRELFKGVGGESLCRKG